MRVEIVYVNEPFETEVKVKCSKTPDAETRKLLRQITVRHDNITGFRDGKVYLLSVENVYYLESVDEKVFCYFETEVYETSKKLYEWEEILKDTLFVRISKSAILNIEKLKYVRPVFNGKMEAVLDNDEKLMINRHYLAGFRQKMGI